MQFTEHEMTTALHGLAKSYLTTTPDTEPADATLGETRWVEMSKFERHTLVSRLSEFVLPVLMALPEVSVEPGQRAEFTAEQIGAAVQHSVAADVEAGKIDAANAEANTYIRAQMSGMALSLLPLKARALSDEETLAAFVVPDSLEGL